jgi:hypothetical protein
MCEKNGFLFSLHRSRLSTTPIDRSTQDLSTYRYELSNHLGNTLTTFTGRKLGQGMIGSEVSHYEPEIVSLGDYDPFGVELYGRSYNNAAYNGTSGYRYGFYDN